jgi:hypothetical protein
VKISSALNHRILNSGEFRNQFGGHVVVDDEDFSDISKLPPPPLPPGITLPPPPPPPAMVLEEEFELDDTIELTETDIGEEISEESNDFQAQWEKRRSSDPSMVTDSKDSMYGHIDRIATGDVGTLLDRFSDRFGSELDREIIVLRKQQQQDIRAVKPTVELVSAPTIEIEERDIDDSHSDEFVEFFDVVNNLLGNMPEDFINRFLDSDSFALFESVGSNPEAADEDAREAFFVMINAELGELPEDKINEFVESPGFEIFTRVGQKYGG